jgi:putative Holliday junction resolvase
MRVLGVDYGLRRIGLAIGETEIKMAFAKGTLVSEGDVERDALAVYRYASEEECDRIIVGLPRLDDGHEGDQAAITRRFGDALASLGAVVAYCDERYSTSAARSALSHLDNRAAKKVLDSEAARVILEAYLHA